MSQSLTQKQLLIPRDAVMNGFCYAYCDALRNKLHKIHSEGEIFLEREKERANRGDSCQINDIVYTLMMALSNQIDCVGAISSSMTCDRVGELITLFDEFLATFERE